MRNNYDYIIAGGGAAGLSLLYRMMQHSFFDYKSILVIDQLPKNKNDRTWCFWEQQPGLFEEVVHHQWKQIDFYSNHFSARFDLFPYSYKMIKSIDFYNYVLSEAHQKSNIHFHYATIQSLSNDSDKAIVVTEKERFSADYIFNSILFNRSITEPPSNSKKYHLIQHFKGWLIETKKNIFDERIATFMDFRVSQQQGTTFAYVLPLSANKALVEYTLFSKQLLREYEYNEALKQYITEYWKVGNYSITEEEFGIIPMTNSIFSKGEGRIVNTGTAGGQTKPSSGFTFRFIQKQTDAIIKALITDKDPHIASSFTGKRFHLYDSTLLNILNYQKMGGDKIFADLFRKNPPQRVLRFLDNETTFFEEIKIMSSVSTGIFFPSAMQELFK